MLIDKFIEEICGHTIRMSVYRDPHTPTEQTRAERNEQMLATARAYEKEIPYLKKEIDAELRKLFGEAFPTTNAAQDATS